jgi:hypothetical protein
MKAKDMTFEDLAEEAKRDGLVRGRLAKAGKVARIPVPPTDDKSKIYLCFVWSPGDHTLEICGHPYEIKVD